MKPSNGFRHARQKCVVRHRVGPKALSNTVSRLPQKGQGVPSERASEARGITTGPREAPGGVIPLHEHPELEQTYVLEGRLVRA